MNHRHRPPRRAARLAVRCAVAAGLLASIGLQFTGADAPAPRTLAGHAGCDARDTLAAFL